MERIGRYKIVGELGRGAMGVVFRALDPTIGREVAIKTIRLAEFADPEQRAKQRERLFREARSAGILSHPNIVTIYDMAEQDDLAYIAMEFVTGSTLEKLLGAGEMLPPERVFSILRQTAAGLDYAHRKGIIHRDVKPANIIINEANEAKIADFGIAKISAADQLTQTGLIVGTPNYMSPEQVQGKPVTGHTDQYALAVIAYEMLTGDKPFVAEHLTTLVYQIVCEPAPPAQRLNPTLGPDIEAVLQRGLSKQPEQRFETCAMLVEQLESACAATPGWKNMTRGASLNLPTMAEAPATLPESKPDSAPRAEPAPPAEAPAPAPAISLPPPPARARESAPVEEKKGNRALPAIAAVVIGIAVAAGYYLTRGPAAEPPPQQQTAETAPAPPPGPAPKQEAPPAPAPPPAQPAKPPESAAATAPAPPPAAKTEAPAPRIAATVELPISSEPAGATVVMDGSSESACVTPCVLKASVGAHALTLTLAGYRPATRQIKVTEGAMDLPTIALEKAVGILMVQSDPSGASITIDDKKWPSVTPAQVSLTPGKYRITIEKGAVRSTQNVEVRDGDLRYLSFSLNR
jgi:serine/threonine protein kinase